MAGPDAAIQIEFESQFDHLFQEEEELFRQFARVKTGVTGQMAGFGLLGPSTMTDITQDRHGDTNWHDSPSYRRWAVKQDFEDAQILDRQDDLQILVDLEMGYAQNSAYAANRKMNEILITAARGTAQTGTFGTTTSTFNTAAPTVGGGGGNRIADGGLTIIEKMKLARRVFNERNVGLAELRRGMADAFVYVMGPVQMQELLDETEATSGDFVGQGSYTDESGRRMPLVDGWIRYYMGFRLLVVNDLPLVSTERVNLAWHRKAMGLAIWAGRRVWTGELPTKHLARGVIVQIDLGAVRIHDAGVLEILNAEA